MMKPDPLAVRGRRIALRKLHLLSEGLERRLEQYALAASTAGMGLLVAAEVAKADTIFTPVNIPIPTARFEYSRSFFGSLDIDLNNDGVSDFRLSLFNSYNLDGARGTLSVKALGGGQTMVTRNGAAAALPAGAVIGASQMFRPNPVSGGRFSGRLMARAVSHFYRPTNNYVSGPWANATNQFLGLRFDFGGQTRFGWAELSVTAAARCCAPVGGVLEGYAYETVPNQPILAGQTIEPIPEPGTLAL